MDNNSRIDDFYNDLVQSGFTFGGKTDRASYDAMMADDARSKKLYGILTDRGWDLDDYDTWRKGFSSQQPKSAEQSTGAQPNTAAQQMAQGQQSQPMQAPQGGGEDGNEFTAEQLDGINPINNTSRLDPKYQLDDNGRVKPFAMLETESTTDEQGNTVRRPKLVKGADGTDVYRNAMTGEEYNPLSPEGMEMVGQNTMDPNQYARKTYDPSVLETVGKSLGAGFTRAGAGIVDVLQQLSSGMYVESGDGYIRTKSYEERIKDKNNPLTKASDVMHETADRMSQEAQPYGGQKGFLDLLWDGEIGKFAQKGLATVGESMPMNLSAYNPYTMVLNAISMAGSNYRDETIENPDTPAWKRASYAIGNAAIEQAVEKYADPVFKYIGGSKGEEVVEDVTKEATESIAKRIYNALGGLAKDAAGEGAEEVITNFGNDALGSVLDWMDGQDDYGYSAQWEMMKKENPDANLLDFAMAKAKENVEAFIGGALAGAYTSGTAQGLVASAKGLSYVVNHDSNGKVPDGVKLDPVTVNVAQSFDDGYKFEIPQDKNDAKNMYDVQRERMNGIVDEDTLNDIEKDPVSWIVANKGNLDADDLQTVLDYANAKATYDGMIQKVRDDIDSQCDAFDKLIDSRTNRAGNNAGMLVPATMKMEGRQVFVIDGDIQMMDDGSMADASKSSESILVRDAETGKLEFVSPHDVLNVGEAVNAEEEKARVREDTTQQIAKEQADQMEGVLAFNVGDVYAIQDEQGKKSQVEVLADNGDGTVMISIDGGTPMPAPKERIQKMSDIESKGRAAERAAVNHADNAPANGEAVAEEPAGNAAGTVAEPSANAQGTVAEEPAADATGTVAGTDVEASGTVSEPMPMVGEGDNAEPDFLSTTPERGMAFLFGESGLDESDADAFLNNNVASSAKEAEKIEGKRPKIGTNLTKFNKDMAAWEASKQEAAAKAEYWKQMKELRDAMVAEKNAERKAAEEARQEAERAAAEADEAAYRAEQERLAAEQAERGANAVGQNIIFNNGTEQETADTRAEGVAEDGAVNNGGAESAEASAVTTGNAAEAIAAAEAETDTNPSEAQKEAGNYKKGHVKVDGYDITIENPKGSVRSGKDADGKEWSVTMNNTYGYIRGTEGVDGDHIDVFLSDNPEQGNVYVVDQVDADGNFDEHKVMYGFGSAEEARDNYLANYSEGWKMGTITEVSKEEFKKWIESSHRKTKPFSEYKSVKKEGAQGEEPKSAGGDKAYPTYEAGTTFTNGLGESMRISEVRTDEKGKTYPVVEYINNKGVVTHTEAMSWNYFANHRMNKPADPKREYIMQEKEQQPSTAAEEGEELAMTPDEPKAEDKKPRTRKPSDAKTDEKIEDVGDDGKSYLFQIGAEEPGTENVTPAQQLATEAIITALGENAGLDVVMETREEGQRVAAGELKNNTPHSYEITEIELLDSPVLPAEATKNTIGISNNSITGANLLKNVEKSYDNGVKILENQQNTAEFMQVWHGSAAVFDHFDGAFMGSGEGSQVYGDGHYVTGVESTGRMYATIATENRQRSNTPIVRWKGQQVDFSSVNPLRLAHDVADNSRTIKEARDRAERYADMAEEDDMKTNWKLALDILKQSTKADFKPVPVNGNRQLYEVEIPDDNGSNYLNWNDAVPVSEQDKIEELLFAEVVNDKESDYTEKDRKQFHDDMGFGNKNLSVGDLYGTMTFALGSKKAASALLRKAGFVGVKVPTGNRRGGDGRGMNYVIFDDNDLKITDRVQFMQRPEGTVYGWSEGNRIHLTPEGINPNTPIHEYTHLWARAVMQKNPKLWNRIKELLQGTPIWEEVVNDPAYHGLTTDDAIASEALSRLSGRKNAEKMEKMAQDLLNEAKGNGVFAEANAHTLILKMKQALKDFWKWVGTNLFDMTDVKNIDEVTDRVLYDMLNKTDLALSEDGDVATEFQRGATLDEVNDRYNEQLAGYTPENADSVILNLGMPSEILKKAGVEDKPMKLYGSKIAKKQKKHGFDVNDLRDLPRAMANPIAVFDNYNKEGNRSVLTELKTNDGNILVAVDLGKGGDIDFNIISSAFGKAEGNIRDWLNRGLATYIDNEKVQDYLHLAALSAAASDNTELSTGAKVQPNNELNKFLGEKLYIRTENFKKWFGDWQKEPKKASKVVDKNGEPLVVYHGTKGTFNTFAYNPEDIGFHFGNKTTARTRVGRGKDARLMPVYLDIKNPLVIDTDLGAWDADYLAEYLAKNNLADKDTLARVILNDAAIEKFGTDVFDASNIQQIAPRYRRSSSNANAKMRELLKGLGYDGIEYSNYYESNGSKSWIALDKSQIKSATENNGEFDAENADIRFRERTEFDDGEVIDIVGNRGSQEYSLADSTMPSYKTKEELLHAFQEKHPAYAAVLTADGNGIEVTAWKNVLDKNIRKPRRRNGEPTKAEKQRAAYVERKTQIAIANVNEKAQKLGLNVEVITDTESLPKNMADKKGWYNKVTGKITIVLPNHSNGQDVMRTLMHEGVAHHGLRQMFGEDFNTFLNNVYANADIEVRRRIAELAARKGWDLHTATEEYLAALAEDIDFERKVDQTWWQKVKFFFIDMLRKAGIVLDDKLTDNDLRYIVWKSYERMAYAGEYGAIRDARTVMMDQQLGTGNFGTRAVADGSRVADGSELLYREGDAEAEAEDSAPLSMNESMIQGLITLAQKNKENAAYKTYVVKAIGGELAKLRKAMSAQKEYDRSTVEQMTGLARLLIKNGMLSNMSEPEMLRLLTIIKNATGRNDITKAAQQVYDLMIKNQLEEAKNMLDQVTHVMGSKVNAQGVEVQGTLDVRGQQLIKAFRKAMSLDEANISELLQNASDRMDSPDAAIADEAATEYDALTLALQYVHDIKDSVADEKLAKEELEKAREAHAAKTDGLSAKAYKEYVQEAEDTIRQKKLERIEAYHNLAARLAGAMQGSIESAKQFREREMERVKNIHHFANSDMQGRPASEFSHLNWKQRLMNNDLLRIILSPLSTADQMLRMVGGKSPNGEGYLYNHFMRGWVDATDSEFKNLNASHEALDKKATEIFGKKMRWSDLYAEERNMPKQNVRFWDDGEMRDHEMTQGQLLYIYMVNKMADGRMKLRKMGIEEEDVQKIKEVLDPRFVQLADWLQEEFLVQKRNEYNKVYERMFGAPMAAIENYFPLKINKLSRPKEEDVNKQEQEKLAATMTGSIIKRRTNSTPLALTGTDAFSVVLDHLQEMENWAAFAELRRDANTMLSYKRLRAQISNMSNVHGAGEELWDNFKTHMIIMMGAYRPKGDSKTDKLAVNIAKGVTTAKISFRPFTAIKQIASSPAYLADASIAHLAESMGNPVEAWNWAMDELPTFSKRWKSKRAGDTRLKESDLDARWWRNKAVDTLSRWGMTPNAFVDAITVAMGGYAIYKTRLDNYLKDGYPKDVAEKKAKQDAAVLVNQTQQSSENAFVSDIQLDRTWLSTSLTVFRNASMAYQRQLVSALRDLRRRMFEDGYKENSIAFMKKQMVRDGLTEEQAERAAERAYDRQGRRSMVTVAVFGGILQFVWNIFPYLVYLIKGDDDDEKKKMLEEAGIRTMFGGIEGLAGGSVISDLATNYIVNGSNWRSHNLSTNPLASDVQQMLNDFSSDEVRGMQDLVNLAVQMGLGVNPQTITDAVVAVIDACDGDVKTSREALLFSMRVLQMPQSQIDKIYLDEVGMRGKDASKLSVQDLAERYAKYNKNRNAPLTQWAYSDEAEQKVIDKHIKKFETQAKERLMQSTGDAKLDDAYEAYEENYKDVKKRLEAVNKLKDEDFTEFYTKMGELASTPEFMKYNTFKSYKTAIDNLMKAAVDADDAARREDYLRMVEDKKRQMVDLLDSMK